MDVRAIREQLSLRQIDLAEILGVHHITVSQWERGRAQPRPWHAGLLAQFATIPEDIPAGPSARQYLVTHGAIRALYELLRHTDAGARALAFDAAIPSR